MSRNRIPTTLDSSTSQAAEPTMAETQRVPLLAPFHALDRRMHQPSQSVRLPPLRIPSSPNVEQLPRDPLLPPSNPTFQPHVPLAAAESHPLDFSGRQRTSRPAAPISDLLSSQQTSSTVDPSNSPNYDLRRSPQPFDEQKVPRQQQLGRHDLVEHPPRINTGEPSDVSTFGMLHLRQHDVEIPSASYGNPYETHGSSRSFRPTTQNEHPEISAFGTSSGNKTIPRPIGHGLAQKGIPHPTPPQCELRIRQQPVAARACGFGERDRRVVDPPPILQLVTQDPPTGSAELDELRYSLYIVHCTLWSADGATEETALRQPDRRTTRRLMGQLVASPSIARDEHNVQGCFFLFPDLSCRTHGRYRLKFILIRLDPENMSVGSLSPILTEVLTDVFTVYTAKDFPGMQPSSALTRALKLQGCNIQVKKGNERTISRKRKPENEVDDALDSNDGGDSLKRFKDID